MFPIREQRGCLTVPSSFFPVFLPSPLSSRSPFFSFSEVFLSLLSNSPSPPHPNFPFQHEFIKHPLQARGWLPPLGMQQWTPPDKSCPGEFRIPRRQ